MCVFNIMPMIKYFSFSVRANQAYPKLLRQVFLTVRKAFRKRGIHFSANPQVRADVLIERRGHDLTES